jgi:hypothetical protein
VGVANVEAQTGRAWEDIVGEWALALWAAGAPELDGVQLDPRLTYGTFPLREILTGSGGYPLRPEQQNFSDFTWASDLLPATFEHFLLMSSFAAGPVYTLSMAGRYGGPFYSGTPRAAVLRVR